MANETAGAAGRPAIDPDIKDAVEGHERFRAEFERDRSFYQGLAKRKQKSRLLWIGCSDSRVVPADITGADPGELFEIRNIANSVPPSGHGDDSVGAAVAYALDHLGIDDIVVCGHTNCGGVAALAQGEMTGADPHLARWIELTRPAHLLTRAARVPEEERPLAAIKAHVQFQIDNLKTYPIVAARLAAGQLGLHGWLYVMESGDILAYDAEHGDWRPLSERHASATA